MLERMESSLYSYNHPLNSSNKNIQEEVSSNPDYQSVHDSPFLGSLEVNIPQYCFSDRSEEMDNYEE